MKLIKFIRKPERDGARVIYFPACAEKISQLAVMSEHKNAFGFTVPEMYFIDTFGLGTIELSKEQINSLIDWMVGRVDQDKVIFEIEEYNTDMSEYQPKKEDKPMALLSAEVVNINENTEEQKMAVAVKKPKAKTKPAKKVAPKTKPAKKSCS